MKNIILKPIISEKMTLQGDRLNRYGFIVHKGANKIEIRKAIQELYNVDVTAVNTIRYGGKAKSRNTRAGIIVGRTSAYKKAIISLAEGEKIDFYSNI
jgi:large subunit ribosomal protein L23